MNLLRRLFGGAQRKPTSQPVAPRPEPAVDVAEMPATGPPVAPRPEPVVDVAENTTGLPANLVRIRGVGQATAANLSAAGLGSVESLQAATREDLLSVPGVGPTTAARLKAYANGDPEPEQIPTSPPRAPTDAHAQPPSSFNASRRIDRGIHEMLGLCRGVLADGVVKTEEALLLANWIEANPDLTHQWPASALANRIDRIFADGVVEPHEQRELEGLLREITGTIEQGEQAVGQSSTLPLDNPPPVLEFDGWQYVFTGRFASGTRRWCQQAVERLGALTTSDVTMHTRVLVIGTYGSRDWAHSSFGRKIQKAMDYRERGADILIVEEAHWSSHFPAG